MKALYIMLSVAAFLIGLAVGGCNKMDVDRAKEAIITAYTMGQQDLIVEIIE